MEKTLKLKKNESGLKHFTDNHGGGDDKSQ